MKYQLFVLAPILGLLACSQANTEEVDLLLWYEAPATEWRESLPIGNGRLGTMIAGNVESDTLIINEETIWSGGIHDYTNPEARSHLEKIRQLISQGNYEKALEVGNAHMIGIPLRQQFYQPLGRLILETNHPGETTGYKRVLDLDNALVSIEYQNGGQTYKREIFASYPDDVMVLRFTTDNEEGMEFNIRHDSEHRFSGKLDGNKYILSGKGDKGRGIDADIRFTSVLEVTRGEISQTENEGVLKISGDKEIIVLYTAATNYLSYKDVSGSSSSICETILDKAREKDYKTLLKDHIEDYSELFDRVDIRLGSEETPALPTDQLLKMYADGQAVPYLEELFYQMSRYLVIASSRPGTQPMNLQGIWNDNMAPPWDCKWTLNINVEMNYWLVEGANLAECHEPLFSMIRDLHETGKKVASEHYGCRGFMVHHNTDVWRGAAPVDGATWGLWPFGGAWLTRHMWEHYLYSQDMEFLKQNYPIMKDASLFFFDYLTEGKDGYLVTSPAISFEQSFKLPDGTVGRLCEGPTMDNQMLRDLFDNCLQAAELMEDDQDYRDSLVLLRDRLRPTQIEKTTGQLMEWAWPAEPSHASGQLAPLWAVNPGNDINFYETPELAKAAETMILYRDQLLPPYEKFGSWVSGTRTNFWARLSNGEQAYAVLSTTLKNYMFSNLLVNFYPKKYFMIDGNLGPAAAMNEMLYQSQRLNRENEIIIDLLPALPVNWKNGHLRGVRARGGFDLDIEWAEGVLKSVKIHSLTGNSCQLLYKDQEKSIHLEPGEAFTWEF